MAREFEKAKIEKMPKQQEFQSAQMECAIAIVLAPKKDGNLQIWVENRKQNYVTKRDQYPILEIDESTDSF